jgi:2-dehydro-3-deoxyphosphogluconate aldolase/(4S)-4-hydroxy-2-oxoglutarate aldolase
VARFKRLQVLLTMEELGLVPVFFTPDPEEARNIAAACAGAGAVCVEMTNRGDHAVDVFSEVEHFLAAQYPRVIFGVGSVVDAATAALYIAHGANFVVGPVLDKETALVCNKHKVPYMPGCGTVSEIQQAHALGVEICKIFPAAAVGGPAFVKAVMGPCPWTSLMPTGGVNPTRESLSAWFEAGVSCVGMGSKLITRELLAKKDFQGISKNIKNALSIIRECKARGTA